MITNQQRVDLVMNYVAAAREVRTRTHDHEANQYLEHLLFAGYICTYELAANGGIATIGLQAISNIFGVDNRQHLSVIPMYDEDRGKGEVWKFFFDDFLDSRGLASYRRVYNELCLRAAINESPFMKANFILHEAGHAYLAMCKGKIGQEFIAGSEEEALEEGQLHAMNARLWRLWGGRDYQIILEKAFYRMEKQSRRKNATGTTGPAFQCDESWSDVLDKVFGPAPNTEMRESRMKRFVLYANLDWIERKGWKPLEQIRAQAIQAAGLA